jgi:addiction module HigA family antidote
MIAMHTPPHPGAVLKDGVFDGSNISVTDFAKHIGMSRVALSRVLNGAAAMSADLAIRLAQALGGSAQSWLRLQADYDVWRLSQIKRARILPIKFGNDDSYRLAA